MTREELITLYKRLPAFKGLVSDDVEMYIDLALNAVEVYAPKRVKLKEIPSSDNGARYEVPEDATTILGAFVTDTNIRIEMREETDSTGDRTYLLLQIQVPSWIDLVRDEGRGGYSSYPAPFASGYRYGSFAGAGYGKHDLDYTVPLAVEDLGSRQLLAVRLYAEGEAYQYQATKSQHLSDITDREASGASTTLRRSQSGNAFQKLSERRQMEFKREIIRPYWAVDTFGLTEYLFKEHRL